MNKDKSIFNISILELILVLFFMFMTITVYQLSFKDTHIDELEKTVESQREVTQVLVKKEYPKLEKKVADLVNLEKYKKLYEESMAKNSGIYYVENKIIGDLSNAQKSKDYKKYEELIKVKNDIHRQILELKGNTLTVNTLNELNIKNEPLHRQIRYLEKKVRDNYQNKLSLANNLKDLKTNETVKYILLKLNKYDAPIQEQLDAINAELKKFDKALLDKNYNIKKDYNSNTNYVLKNIKYDNKPLNTQIKVLKHVLENQKLQQKIKTLENQLANNQKARKYSIDTNNAQNVLKNLQDIKNSNLGKYEVDTKDILRKLKQNNKPLDKQISELKKQLQLAKDVNELNNRIKKLQGQLEQNRLKTPDINKENIQKALKNLQDIKNNVTTKYEPNTNKILQELKDNNKPLDKQISELKKQVELKNKNKNLEDIIKDLKKQLEQDRLKDPNITNENIQKALNNLQDIKNDTSGKYDQKTKDLLKELEQSAKPIDEQIAELKKHLDMAQKGKELENQIKDLKKQLDKDIAVNNPDITNENIQNALDDLQNIKNNTTAKYEPKTKDILRKLKQDTKPLDEQIKKLKKEQELIKKGKDLENKIKDLENKLDKNRLEKPKVSKENIQKALKNLEDIKADKAAEFEPKTKEILKELRQDNKPLNEQINNLKKEQESIKNAEDLKKQIKDLQKELAKNKEQKSPNITQENIQKALTSLENIKNNSSETTPSEKIYLDKLQDALDGLKEIQKIKEQLSNNKEYKPKINKDIEQTIKYLEDKEKQTDLKPNEDVIKVLDKFKIKGKPTNDQMSDLYLNLYSTPVDNTNISELNFVINRLNDQDELENRIERIDEILKDINRPKNSFFENYINGTPGKNNEIRTLKNQIKYLQKKIEKSGKLHLPCILDDDGKTLYLFKLFLREENIYVELGWQEGVAQVAKDLPNMDKLVDKTLELDEFMDLTKAIFEKSVQDECRQFVYFEDETISKKEYKRKTLTIQHHFYKYIEHTW